MNCRWPGSADVTSLDVGDTVTDPLAHRASVRGEPLEVRQMSPVLLVRCRVHEALKPGIRASLSCGQVSEHEMGDGGLVSQVPADSTGMLVRAPGEVVVAQVAPEQVRV